MGNIKSRITQGLCRFIPTHIGNAFLLWCLQVMRFFQRHGDMYALSHTEANKLHEPETGFIENQNSMHDIYMGMASMAEAGCEIIATYNALFSIGKGMPLSQLIGMYERDGIIYSGRFGVAPKAIADTLNRNGCKVTKYIPSKKKCDIDGFARGYDTLIMTIYNDGQDLMKEIHTVMIDRTSEGYTAHNMHCNGKVTVAYENITALIAGETKGKGKPIIIMGVNV